MKRFLVSALTVAAIAASTGRAEAVPLVITDSGKLPGLDATWTLDATGGCTVCTVTLSVVFTGNTEYDGTLLDGIQWKIDGGDLQSATLTNTTAGTINNWELFVNSNLNQGGGSGACGGGAQDNLCANYIALNPTQSDFGFPITDGLNLSWTFSATFASALPTTLTTGNIRGLFNNPDGSNYNIFSPSGGTFQGQGTPLQGQGQPQQGSPEPASVLLFGAALTAVGMRLRRARA